jgi:hypothetical protein
VCQVKALVFRPIRKYERVNMRKFLKRLRKGIRTACLTTALATCWGVGQTAQVSAAPVEVRFSGTVSPVVNNVSHLFIIYSLGSSSIEDPLSAIQLGDFSAGQTTAFSVVTTMDVGSYDNLWWYVAGLYGNTTGGEYSEGVNGITLGIDASEGDSWSSYFSPSEADIFTHLLNDNPGNLPSFNWSWDGWYFSGYSGGIEITGSSTLFDFSVASNNGQINFESEIVPEPITIVLLGTGGFFVLRRRRDND